MAAKYMTGGPGHRHRPDRVENFAAGNERRRGGMSNDGPANG